VNEDGSAIEKLSGFKVYRVSAPLDEECDDCSQRTLRSYIDYQNPSSATIKDGKVIYTDEKVEQGNIYVYEVAAQNAEGRESELSQAVEVALKQPPPSPKGLIAMGKGAQVGLEWESPARPSGIRGYRIYRGLSRNPWDMELAGQTRHAETFYTDRDVGRDRLYYYCVRAYKMVKGIPLQSAASDVVSAQVSGAALAPPEDVHAMETGGSVTVFWSPVKLEDEDVRYNIYRSIDGGEFVKLNSRPLNELKYQDTDAPGDGASGDSSYRYRVTAFPKTRPSAESRYSRWVTIRRGQ
jgi:fibronectin type 3 domain-containing protein